MTLGLACTACGTALRENAKFCDECGAATAPQRQSAEYKQVTVLFADVVQSMKIAAAVGPERLRELMVELVNRVSVVVHRYGGTLDKFTGDGVMAVFGAPVSLEDHAFRACLAAVATQEMVRGLAADARQRDGVELQLRIGLNSGQVIAGDVGGESLGYTAIGEQVGMAQRMESVAPAGGVMLSESTARLVASAAVLGEPEPVRIKGADEPVLARRLLGVMPQRGDVGPHVSPLVGRDWELAAVTAMLDRAVKGHGCIAGLVGPAGIGKSRLVAEAASAAAHRGLPVYSTFCESHTSEVPFFVSTRLLRAAFVIEGLEDETARARVREQVPDANADDLALLDDVLGIRDPGTAVPDVAADARRRRLTALVNAAALARPTPEVYVIEDAHWVDQTSESLLAEFLSVVPQTRFLVLITYRPEYRGALAQAPGAQTIALAPLDDTEIEALSAELLGRDPTVASLISRISDRAAGNPFFAEQIVRDLCDRGVITGVRGAYAAGGDVTDVAVPATLQAAIAARIDRLNPQAKRTLSAAAVIGLRFDDDLLGDLVDTPAIAELIHAELIDQVRFTPQPEYVFRHPLIHAVAYESQLKSDRAELHRRVASAIEACDPASAEENAALVAEHLEAAGDVLAAYSWHMRAGAWLIGRDIAAALMSWERACQIADALPNDHANRAALRIGPRSMLCANAFRVHAGDSAARFPELQELCAEAGDKSSLAIGMTGLLADTVNQGRLAEGSHLADDHLTLLESVGDAALTVGLSFMAILIKAKVGRFFDAMQWSQRVVDLAAGEPAKASFIWDVPLASVLSLRGVARACLGVDGWRQDLDDAVAMVRTADAMSRGSVIIDKYWASIPTGALASDDAALQEIRDVLRACEEAGDDFALGLARVTMGIALIYRDSTGRDTGLKLLTQVRDMVPEGRYPAAELPMINAHIAYERARGGERPKALRQLREAVEELYGSRHFGYSIAATSVLVETLLDSHTEDDLREAETAIDRLAAVPFDQNLALCDIMVLRLRALVARARGDAAHRSLVEQYRRMARSFGYEGHIVWADEMAAELDAP